MMEVAPNFWPIEAEELYLKEAGTVPHASPSFNKGTSPPSKSNTMTRSSFSDHVTTIRNAASKNIAVRPDGSLKHMTNSLSEPTGRSAMSDGAPSASLPSAPRERSPAASNAPHPSPGAASAAPTSTSPPHNKAASTSRRAFNASQSMGPLSRTSADDALANTRPLIDALDAQRPSTSRNSARPRPGQARPGTASGAIVASDCAGTSLADWFKAPTRASTAMQSPAMGLTGVHRPRASASCINTTGSADRDRTDASSTLARRHSVNNHDVLTGHSTVGRVRSLSHLGEQAASRPSSLAPSSHQDLDTRFTGHTQGVGLDSLSGGGGAGGNGGGLVVPSVFTRHSSLTQVGDRMQGAGFMMGGHGSVGVMLPLSDAPKSMGGINAELSLSGQQGPGVRERRVSGGGPASGSKSSRHLGPASLRPANDSPTKSFSSQLPPLRPGRSGRL